MKRNIIYIALGAIALMMTPSCTDFLKENPQTFESPDNYYTTQEEMQKAVNGCYGTSTSDYIQGLPCMFQGMIGLGMNGHIYLEGMTGYSDRLTATNYRDMGFLLRCVRVPFCKHAVHIEIVPYFLHLAPPFL